jgi:asparagine synthase (glutamine-hydrolysing)
MLRGPVLKALSFFDRKMVVALLDELPGMDVGSRRANGQILMLLVSKCVLRERYGLAA